MRKTTVVLASSLAFGCGVAVPSWPEPVTEIGEARYAESIAAADSVLAYRNGSVPGLTVAVWHEGEVVWSVGYGWADVEERVPLTPGHALRVYSVTKPLTSVLALTMVQDGLLDLDAPIGGYAEVPQPYRELTARQLLSHTSGIRDYRDGEWLRVSSSPCGAAAEGVAPFAEDSLEFSPGSRHAYSSFNYVLVSAVLEAVAERPFWELMEERVLDPAGMSATRQDTPSPVGANAPTFYEPGSFGRIRAARAVDNRCKFGGGGALATAEDLVRFGGALVAGDLLESARLEEMLSPVGTAAGPGTYALGWGVGTDSILGAYAVHSGSAIGGTAYLVVAPERRVSVGLIANIEAERLTEALTIARLFARD